MHRIRDLIARHPVASYLAIAFTTTYTLTFAAGVSLAFALLALFGPAFAAIVVSRADGSWPVLRARITAWRRPAGTYLVAVGIPFAVAGMGRLVLEVAGKGPDGLGTISPIEMVIFVLVIGEEIGWRGFLQPRLRTRFGLGLAGLLTGVVWAAWHLPIYVAPEQGPLAFLAFAWWVLPLSVAMGAVAESARWSVIVATVMHGAANIATPILLPGIDRPTWLLLTGALYAVAAIGLVLRAMRRGTSGQIATAASPLIAEPSAVQALVTTSGPAGQA